MSDQFDVVEQHQIRREKRARMIGTSREPYPVDMSRTHTLAQVRAGWPDLAAGAESDDIVEIGGRVVFLRNTGKLCFATLQDGFDPDSDGERLQVMVSLAEVGEQGLGEWKADVDLGDFIWVRGRVVSSRRGELSVMASEWKMASKALRPLPVLHKDLSEEARVRRRYADLIVRPEAREIVRVRAAITKSLRRTLDEAGFLEVETPTLQLIHGGAAARPFRTHLNAFDIDMTLRIALELYLKRAMVGGVDSVYEIGRIFRNEGIDSTHSAEFTMLEAYQSWGDHRTIAELTKKMIMDAADVVGIHQIVQGGRVGDLLDLAAIQELSQGVGIGEGPGGIELDTEQVLVRLDDPRQFEAPPPGRDGRRQVEGDVTRLEGWLTVIEVTEGPDLGQERRVAAARQQDGVGQFPAAPAGGGEDQGVGDGLGAGAGQFVHDATRQVFGEGPVRRDRVPARSRPVEEARHPCSSGGRS